ncbi:unnamed protein product [Thlaspi arvense]|uniref:CBS domain-containing protein n=1 Tax=Thlaspi arvense TaxID=13288 RepID=A0AAU9RWC6_THLAR|nr:unnamed protein product [Thlaspi arvense]
MRTTVMWFALPLGNFDLGRATQFVQRTWLHPRSGFYTVGDFMTRKEDLHVVKPTTSVDEALEILVEKRITGFPVIDDDWKLVGLVSDYDLLALDSISEQSLDALPMKYMAGTKEGNIGLDFAASTPDLKLSSLGIFVQGTKRCHLGTRSSKANRCASPWSRQVASPVTLNDGAGVDVQSLREIAPIKSFHRALEAKRLSHPSSIAISIRAQTEHHRSPEPSSAFVEPLTHLDRACRNHSNPDQYRRSSDSSSPPPLSPRPTSIEHAGTLRAQTAYILCAILPNSHVICYALCCCGPLHYGGGQAETSMFPEVDSTWKGRGRTGFEHHDLGWWETFNEVQRLLSKTNGQVVGDLMTPAPVVVRESTNLEDAARLLLKTNIVDFLWWMGRVGIITRGNIIRAALHIKHATEA